MGQRFKVFYRAQLIPFFINGGVVEIVSGASAGFGAELEALAGYQQTSGNTAIGDNSRLVVIGSYEQTAGLTEAQGPLQVTGDFQLDAGTVVVMGSFSQDGNLLVTGNYSQNGGTLEIRESAKASITGSAMVNGGAIWLRQDNTTAHLYSPAGITIASGGTLKGTGGITGSVINSGLVTPSDYGEDVTGGFYIIGDYTQTSSGTFEVDVDIEPITDGIGVTGFASFGGTLYLRWLGTGSPNGFWIVVNGFAGSSGTFTLAGAPGFTDLYFPTYVRLEAGGSGPIGGTGQTPRFAPVDANELIPSRARVIEAVRGLSEEVREEVSPTVLEALTVKKTRPASLAWLHELVFASAI